MENQQTDKNLGDSIAKNNVDSEKSRLDESEPVVCKGCSKSFKRSQVHLRSKNGSKCKGFYNENDIELKSPNKWNVYYQRNKEKILLKSKSKYDQNKENVLENKKRHYDQNQEKILDKKKCHYDQNKKCIKLIRKEHHDKNRKIILKKIQEKRENMSLDDCLAVFQREIVWGSIYPCMSCHRACFRNGVNIFKLS